MKIQVYQFRMWNKKFAVDIESGNFFEVDKVASEAVALMHRYSDNEVMQRLSSNYGKKSADITMQNLSKLKKKGMLFSSPGRLLKIFPEE